MAKPRQRTIVSRLADAGEDAIQRLGGAPGADRLLGAMNMMRDRLDEMQKRMRALPAVEKRLDAVEKRLDKLEGKGSATRSRSTSRTRTTSASSTSRAKKTS